MHSSRSVINIDLYEKSGTSGQSNANYPNVVERYVHYFRNRSRLVVISGFNLLKI